MPTSEGLEKSPQEKLAAFTEVLAERFKAVSLEPITSIAVDINSRVGGTSEVRVNSKKVGIGTGERGDAVKTYLAEVRKLFPFALRVLITLDPEKDVVKDVQTFPRSKPSKP